jgi:hypothetical protein
LLEIMWACWLNYVIQNLFTLVTVRILNWTNLPAYTAVLIMAQISHMSFTNNRIWTCTLPKMK